MADDAQYESLSTEELGLPPDTGLPLRFVPAERWSPLVISFPHVGLKWPHDLRPKPQVEFARNADYEVHTLYREALALGAASVAAVFSRLVVDLNRAPDDVSTRVCPDHPAPRPRRSPGMPEGPPPATEVERPGRGVVWAAAVGPRPDAPVRVLDRPLSLAEFDARIARFHRPYYRALEVLLARRRRRFGFAILLDAHSMPGSVRPDLVLGTLRGQACDREIARRAFEALSPADAGRAPLSVRIDDPYRGGEVVRHFGRPSEGIHALQLEVNRRLYMDETAQIVRPLPERARPEPSIPAGDPVSGDVGTARHKGAPGDLRSPGRPAFGHSRAQAARRGEHQLADLLDRITRITACLAASDDVGLADRRRSSSA